MFGGSLKMSQSCLPSKSCLVGQADMRGPSMSTASSRRCANHFLTWDMVRYHRGIYSYLCHWYHWYHWYHCTTTVVVPPVVVVPPTQLFTRNSVSTLRFEADTTCAVLTVFTPKNVTWLMKGLQTNNCPPSIDPIISYAFLG